ncbi:hypothetical protein [Bernardetia litoralis]|nr:hypothetical protein [Bernardetia litoralis]
MKYLLLFILSCLISTSVFAQVFFKQRVYGNEKREEKTLSTVEVDNSYEVGKAKIKGETYILFNTHTSEWKEQPINFHRRTAIFYLKDEKKALSLSEGKQLMKELGERKVVAAINKSKLGTAGGRLFQYIGCMGGALAIINLARNAVDGVNERGLAVLGASAVVWYGGRQLVILSRNPIRNRLDEYNSRLAKTEKNFYPSFKPSAITFKPVQTSPFTPSITPTLGLSWKL